MFVTKMQCKSCLSIVAISLLGVASAAASAASDVDSIVRHVDQLDTGKTSQADIVMTIVDQRGSQRVRQMHTVGRNTGDAKSKVLVFVGPEDVKDTAYLSIEWKDSGKNDESWLYLPALHRVKRVASTSKSDAFMGSDFTYSDINGSPVTDWTYKIVQESDPVDGHDCWLLQSTPKAETQQKVLSETGYSKREVWVRKDNYYIVKGKFYVEKDSGTKELTVKDVTQIDGVWTAKSMAMKTLRNGQVIHQTSMDLKNVVYNQSIDQSILTPQGIERGMK